MTQINNKNYALNLWLILMCFSIILMIFIGGVTRLTESGLSITEWKPITGVVPPLNETSWKEEFVKYQKSPEYILQNSSIELSEFKSLYLIEFFHRLAGRFVSLLFIFPMLFFILRRDIQGDQRKTYLAILTLFALQGLMGWYMVKSGLTSSPYVSHFRLAAHLMLAVIMYMMLFWQLMKNSFDIMLIPVNEKLCKLSCWCKFSIILLLIQMMFGAFVAGLDAGLVYNDFPLMGDYIIPQEILNRDINSTILYSFVSDPVFVQFIHRIIAYLLLVVVGIFCFYGIYFANNKFKRVVIYIFSALILQIILGILTLVYQVPIIFALMHQFGAMLLLSLLCWSYFLIKSTER